jgi:hypothetical protein
MVAIIIFIIICIISFFSFVFTWKIYPIFWSGSEKWRTSPFHYFIQRLTVASLVSFCIFGGLTLFLFSVMADVQENASGNARPQEAQVEANIPVIQVETPREPQRVDIHVSVSEREPVQVVANATSCDADAVAKLEEEKQYSGNDPVIRQRLGLPEKCN